MKRLNILFFFVFFGIASIEAQEVARGVGQLKLNQIQVLASHNSYKQAIEPELMKYLLRQDSSRLAELDYAHLPLQAQLDLGIRKLEIDVFHDPEGGKFAHPMGISTIKELGKEPLIFDPANKMSEKGFKVLHVQDIDFRSHCLLLSDCLEELVEWSENHPDHLPIIVSFNAKDAKIPLAGFEQPFPFTSTTFDSLDQAILNIIPASKIIKPDDIRVDGKSLEVSVLTNGWPLLTQVLGKFLFVLDEKGKKLEEYRLHHPSLEGRVMFANAKPGQPEAAFIIFNNPVPNLDSIQTLVKKGYLLRTRADAGTKEARRGDYERMNAAFESGAHFISTDYYVKDQKFGKDFQVRMPGGFIARPNPLFFKRAVELSVYGKKR